MTGNGLAACGKLDDRLIVRRFKVNRLCGAARGSDDLALERAVFVVVIRHRAKQGLGGYNVICKGNGGFGRTHEGGIIEKQSNNSTN